MTKKVFASQIQTPVLETPVLRPGVGATSTLAEAPAAVSGIGSWPFGRSVQTITSSPGWPVDVGIVITDNMSNGARTTQWVYETVTLAQAATGWAYYRCWDASGWTAFTSLSFTFTDPVDSPATRIPAFFVGEAVPPSARTRVGDKWTPGTWTWDSTLGRWLSPGGFVHRTATGQTTITPVANTPTSKSVTFPAGRFTVLPSAQVSVNTTTPGTVVTGWAFNGIGLGGITLWVTRTNITDTNVTWMATQMTDGTTHG